MDPKPGRSFPPALRLHVPAPSPSLPSSAFAASPPSAGAIKSTTPRHANPGFLDLHANVNSQHRDLPQQFASPPGPFMTSASPHSPSGYLDGLPSYPQSPQWSPPLSPQWSPQSSPQVSGITSPPFYGPSEDSPTIARPTPRQRADCVYAYQFDDKGLIGATLPDTPCPQRVQYSKSQGEQRPVSISPSRMNQATYSAPSKTDITKKPVRKKAANKSPAKCPTPAPPDPIPPSIPDFGSLDEQHEWALSDEGSAILKARYDAELKAKADKMKARHAARKEQLRKKKLEKDALANFEARAGENDTELEPGTEGWEVSYNDSADAWRQIQREAMGEDG